MPRAGTALDPARIADISVSGPAGRNRGSGYRVTTTSVLTAAHLLTPEASEITVRFNADQPGEWSARAEPVWTDTAADIAVLVIDQGGEPLPEPVVPPDYGGVIDRDAVLHCVAVGFPRFKLRPLRVPGRDVKRATPGKAWFRDSYHAVGTIAVLSNRREHTLEMTVAPAAPDPDPGASPWRGMSGAAVWVEGRVIGVISEHHPADGLGRLAVARLDRCLGNLGSQAGGLLPLLGLPAGTRSLPSVNPAPRHLATLGHLAQVRELAPRELLDRDAELADLVCFCSGREPYAWWQGDPWTGKSALAASFVLHPPDGVDVVSFFVNGRLAGQADSHAFTVALLGQLAALTGEPVPARGLYPAAAELDQLRHGFLESAAAAAAERGRRLLLIVDGLDEDQGVYPGSGYASIASLLPRYPHKSLRVLVTSRRHPRIPDDVPEDHPLRQCEPRTLRVSPHAQGIGRLARQELLGQLHRGPGYADIIGFLAAARDGLTVPELAELTGQPRYQLEPRLAGAFGRSLVAWAVPGTSEEAYAFAHGTLLDLARQQLGQSLEQYRAQVIEWADRYRASGWPSTTPRFLLEPYGQFLSRERETDLLAALAADRIRAGCLRQASGTNATALAEIAAALELHLAAGDPDVSAVARLAMIGAGLRRTAGIAPRRLVATFARLGDMERAEALALGGTSSQHPDLDDLAGVLTDRGQWDDAIRVAASMDQAWLRERALSRIARSLAEHGQWTDAEDMALAIGQNRLRDGALGALAIALARAKEWDESQRIAGEIRDSEAAGRAALELAKIASSAAPGQFPGLLESAERAAHAALPAFWPQDEQEASDPARLARLLGNKKLNDGMSESISMPPRLRAATKSNAPVADLVRWLAETGRWTEAETAARRIPDAWERPAALLELSLSLADAGHWDDAERVASQFLTGWARTTALTALAGKAAADSADRGAALAKAAEQFMPAAAGFAERANARYELANALARSHPAEAMRLAAEAAELVSAVYRDEQRLGTITALVAVIRDGNRQPGVFTDAAVEVADEVSDPTTRAEALTEIAAALESLDATRSLRLATAAAELITSLPRKDNWYPETFCSGVSGLISVLSRLGAYEQAERLVPLALPGHMRWEILKALSLARAVAGRWDDAERYAMAIGWSSTRDWALRDLCKTAAEDGRMEDALRFARGINSFEDRDRAYAHLAHGAASAGHWDSAAEYAGVISDGNVKGAALVELCTMAAEADAWDTAPRLAASADGAYRDQALASLARSAATAARWLDATGFAEAITDQRQRVPALAAIAATAADSDTRRSSDFLEAAVGLAHAGEGDTWRAETLTQLAGTAMKLGSPLAEQLLAQAESLASKLRDPSKRAGILAALAGNLARSSPHRAADLALTAEATIRSIPGGAPGLLADLVAPLTDAGHREKAERLAQEVLSGGSSRRARGRALGGIAVTTATSLALACQEPMQWNEVASSSHIYSRAHHLAILLARTLAAEGRWSDAERVVEGIPRAIGRMVAYIQLAEFPAEHAARFADAADAIIQAIPQQYGYAKEKFLEDACEAVTKSRRWGQAERLATAIPGDFQRSRALTALVRGMSDATDWRAAERVISAIPSEHARESAVRDIVSGLNHAGFFGSAEQLAVSRLGSYDGSDGHAEFAGTLIRRQRWTRAEQEIDLVDDHHRRMMLLSSLASALIGACLWDDAERVIAGIGDRGSQASLTTELAAALAAAGDPRARDIAEKAARLAQPEVEDDLPPVLRYALAEALAATSIDTSLRLIQATDGRDPGAEVSQVAARAKAAMAASLASAAHWPQARQILEDRRGGAAANLLSLVVRGMARAPLTRESASRLAGLIEQITATDELVSRRAKTLIHLGAVATRAGLPHLAAGPLADVIESLIATMDNDQNQCAAYSALAAMLSEVDADRSTGAAWRAMQAAARIPEERSRQDSLNKAIFAFAKLGCVQDAERIASAFSGSPKVLAFTAIAEGLMDADPDSARKYAAAAERLADDIPDEGQRGAAWDIIAEVVAVTDPAWSLRLADKAQTGRMDDMDWGGTVSIAIALSAAGIRPHQLLRRIPGEFQSEIFFSVEVRSLIETARWKEAERLCGDMWSRDDDEGAWTELTWELLAASRWEDAERTAVANPAPPPETPLIGAIARFHQAPEGPERDVAILAARREAAHFLARLGTEGSPPGRWERNPWEAAFTLTAMLDRTAVQSAAEFVEKATVRTERA